MILMDARAPIMDPPNQDFANSLQTLQFWRYYELRLSLYSIPYFIQLFIHSLRLAPQYELLASFPHAQQLSKNLTDFFWREGVRD